jgi:hypothetical protein
MIASRSVTLALLGGLLCVPLASGQTQKIQDEVDQKLEQVRAPQRAENVEILGRLLHTAFEASYGPVSIAPRGSGTSLPPSVFELTNPGTGSLGLRMGSAPGNVSGQGRSSYNFFSVDVHAHSALPYPEGVYLKGQGVIYQVTLPPPPSDPVKTQPAAKVVAPSPWDRARSEVRGEKLPATQPDTSVRPSLTDAVLRTLAENGQHFTHLPENERITIVVTFRGTAQSCVACHATPFGGSAQGMSNYLFYNHTFNPRDYANPLLNKNTANAGDPQPGQQANSNQQSAPPKPKEAPGEGQQASDTANYQTLGDLHFRQRKYAEAIQAFSKAIEAKNKLLAALDPDSQSTRREKVLLMLSLAELYTKVAQCNFALVEHDAGIKYLELATRMSRDAAQLADGLSKQPASTTQALPHQLVISVPKRLLDEVGNGGLSFDAFRSKATVEYRTYSVPEKK